MNVTDLTKDEELAKAAASEYVDNLPDLPDGSSAPQGGGNNSESCASPFDWLHDEANTMQGVDGYVESLPDQKNAK